MSDPTEHPLITESRAYAQRMDEAVRDHGMPELIALGLGAADFLALAQQAHDIGEEQVSSWLTGCAIRFALDRRAMLQLHIAGGVPDDASGLVD